MVQFAKGILASSGLIYKIEGVLKRNETFDEIFHRRQTKDHKKGMKKLVWMILSMVVLCLCMTACGTKGNTLLADVEYEIVK